MKNEATGAIPISMKKKPPDNPGSKTHKGIFLHASSVIVSGKALLFLGHSSSGKSTISRLLSERYPIIADDKVYICKNKNGDWSVCDGSDGFPLKQRYSPSAGRQKSYPLFAVLRIFKSKSMKIMPISPKETCRYLMDAVFEIDIQRKQKDLKIMKQWFALTAEISRKIKGWRLAFRKDLRILGLIKEAFE